jgi:gluconolactonase
MKTTIATLAFGLLGLAAAQENIEAKVSDFATANCPFDGQANPVIIKDGFSYLEGALWLNKEKTLLVSDVSADKIFALKGKEGFEEWRGNTGLYSNGIAVDTTGAVITTENKGIARVDTTNRYAGEIIADSLNGMKFNNPNDVVVDYDGNILFTDPTYGGTGEIGKRGVYQIMGKSGEVKIIAQYDAPSQPNGIALSPDQKTLYTVDGSDGKLRAFTRGEDGVFASETLLTTVPVGGDGMVVDKRGMIYVTTGVNQVIVYNAMGQQCENVLQFDEPATSLAFGGLNMKALFITTQHTVAKVNINNLGFIPSMTKPVTSKDSNNKSKSNLKGGKGAMSGNLFDPTPEELEIEERAFNPNKELVIHEPAPQDLDTKEIPEDKEIVPTTVGVEDLEEHDPDTAEFNL